jgi:hypothetical protein
MCNRTLGWLNHFEQSSALNCFDRSSPVEHEDSIYVIQALKDPNPVLHRCVGDRNRGLINPRKCISRLSCYTTLNILTFAR